jgi:hypothetical protein
MFRIQNGPKLLLRFFPQWNFDPYNVLPVKITQPIKYQVGALYNKFVPKIPILIFWPTNIWEPLKNV